MRILKVRRHFDAAHHLDGYQGACANIHGHTWKVVVSFKVTELDQVGMAVDFKVVKKLIDECLPDYKYLNNMEEIDFNPTAEHLSNWIWRNIKCKVEDLKLDYKLHLKSVELFESDDCSIEVNNEI